MEGRRKWEERVRTLRTITGKKEEERKKEKSDEKRKGRKHGEESRSKD